MREALARAARLLVRTALKVRENERVLVVHDALSEAVDSVLLEAALDAGAWARVVSLDKLPEGGARPLRALPESIAQALVDAHASVFVASALHHESAMRQAFLHAAQEARVRHAHMPGISQAAFVAGLQVDAQAVAASGRMLLRRLEGARTIAAETRAGTALRVELDPHARWFAQLGELEPGTWANFPAGALYTSPSSVSGTFVADASLGEFFGARAGLLGQKPVRFEIEAGRVVRVECASDPLRRDVEAMLAFSANSARVGLVAIGVNAGIERPIGDAVVDQNVPGLHLGIGDPAGRATGAAWSAPTCFAACSAEARVVVDNEIVIDGGKLRSDVRRRESGVRPL